MSRLRDGQSTRADWELLLTRQPTCVENLNDFQTATRLYYSNKQVTEYNYQRLIQLNTPVAIVHARHSSEKVKHVSSQDMLGLQPMLFISKGACVMLTMNLWPSVGLCNGSTGTVVDIIYAVDHQPPDLPIAVVVKFDQYTGPAFANQTSCVPIPPITATVTTGNLVHERQQISLKLAWALTIHKSQGMTLQKAWVDIGKRETTLGVSYVAISRVCNLSSIVIESVTYDRMLSIKKSELIKYRIKEEKRLSRLAENTTANIF